MKNQGISLISLIITIIVIIILAAIVIFSGLGTPDSAQFAGFTQQVDNVYQAVMNKYGDLKAKHAISGDYRTDEQIYIEIATAADPGQYAIMNVTQPSTGSSSTGIATSSSARVQNIETAYMNLTADNGTHKVDSSLKMNLPKVRQSDKAWYITKDGRVFNANGYTYDKKTYFSGSIYTAKEIPAVDSNNSTRAIAIWNSISGDGVIVTGVN